MRSPGDGRLCPKSDYNSPLSRGCYAAINVPAVYAVSKAKIREFMPECTTAMRFGDSAWCLGTVQMLRICAQISPANPWLQ
jgi:hypothetical protein